VVVFLGADMAHLLPNSNDQNTYSMIIFLVKHILRPGDPSLAALSDKK
jgi:hypothetical protein